MGGDKNDPKNAADQSPLASEAASHSSAPRPGRHIFILRLIPDFHSDVSKSPRWRGELEHLTCSTNSEPQRFSSVNAMLKAVNRIVRKILTNRPGEKTIWL